MITVSELYEGMDKYTRFMTENEYSENTIKTYTYRLNAFSEWLSTHRVELVDKQALIDFKNHLIGNFKPSTVNLYITAVNALLTHCGHKELTLKQVRQQKKFALDTETTLTREEYERLLQVADRRTGAIMKALASTGMRYSELKFLTVEGLKNSTITITNKGKVRTIPYPQGLKAVLKAYAEERGQTSGIIFHGRSLDRLIDKGNLSRDLKKVSRKAGVNEAKAHCHAFRHLFGYEANANGTLTVDAIKNIMGHDSINTTLIYTMGTTDDYREKMERLAL